MYVEKEFDLLVMIGRFRLFHKGHQAVLDEALKRAHNVLVLVGSANRSRDSKGNEFTAVEAGLMIRAQYPNHEEDGGRMSIRFINDEMYDEQDIRWLMGVQSVVAQEVKDIQRWRNYDEHSPKIKVGLIGFSKDNTSYYLKKFPHWGKANVSGYKKDGEIISASDLRNSFFYGSAEGPNSIEVLRDRVPDRVRDFLKDWASKPHNQEIVRGLQTERQFGVNYKLDHQFRGKLDEHGRPVGIKYEPTHATVDSVIIQSAHVLLIRRGHNPGKGKLALPGGFINPGEKPSEAMIREAKEETQIGLSPNVLKLALRSTHTFVSDTPRGTFNKHVGLFVLNDRVTFPAIKASDDAEPGSAAWVPLGELDPTLMTEDHYWLIMRMIQQMIGE